MSGQIRKRGQGGGPATQGREQQQTYLGLAALPHTRVILRIGSENYKHVIARALALVAWLIICE